MQKDFIIADDLTGAMDTGVQLARAGRSVCLAMPEIAAEAVPDGYDSLVLDTESRNLAVQEAADAVAVIMKRAVRAGYTLSYQKIDSTLRGNPGAEIEAALDVSGLAVALVAPAMPTNGRTTRNGCHYVHNRPLAETEFARDPYKPIRTSDIRDILAGQTCLSSDLLHLDVLRQGRAAAAAAIRSMMQQGTRLIVCDGETTGDFKCLTEVIRQLAGQCLPCGAAELLSSLLENSYDRPAPADCRLPPEISDAPCLVVSGSPAEIAKKQIAAVSPRADTVVFTCRPAACAKDGCFCHQTPDSLYQQMNRAMQAGFHVVIDAAGSSKAAVFAEAGGDIGKMRQEGRLIQAFLAEITCRLLQDQRTACGGLVCFGGDTARNILRKLQVSAIRIDQEVERFIPTGRLLNGAAAGLRLITKAGGFGDEQTLQRILDQLHH